MVNISKPIASSSSINSSNNNEQRLLITTQSQSIYRNIPYVILSILCMHIVYIYLYHIYEHSTYIIYHTLQIPTKQECHTMIQFQNNDKCGRPDLFAFQMVSGIVFFIVGVLGLYTWYYTTTKTSKVNSTSTSPIRTNKTALYVYDTPELRLFGNQILSQYITIINCAYQIWDFIVSLSIPEHRTIIMLLHHTIAALVSFSGIYNSMMGYYAIFFLGLSEVSSIFLVALDISKYFMIPSSSSSLDSTTTTTMTSSLFIITTISQYSGPLFVITFMYYRILLWWPMSIQLYHDVQYVIHNHQAETLRPNRLYILYLWLICNIPMGLLQFYFLSLIIQEAKAVIIAAM